MNISEMIKRLEKIKAKHGDLPVVMSLFDEEESTKGLIAVTGVKYLSQKDVDNYDVCAYRYDNNKDCVKIGFVDKDML